MENQIKEHVYHVKGIHCASCEIIIEKKLLKLHGIKSVDASANGEVIIEYTQKKPHINYLNQLFKNEGYTFFEREKNEKVEFKKANYKTVLTISLLILGLFYFLKKSGLSELINVDSNSSLLMFFTLGLIAGVSSCAALIGGLILSMSKQWHELYSKEHSFAKKLQPHLMFNIGRLLSYAFLGFLLGAIGSKLQFAPSFTSILVIAVSIIMILLAFQMLGIKNTSILQFFMPKSITRFTADERNFKGKYMPFLMGAMTFFLPCGFTITAQGLALISGNAIQGSLIMFSFALGTFIPLLLIGISSLKLFEKQNIAQNFTKIAGILVLFFGLYNINNQLNVLGLPSFNNLQNTNAIEQPINNNNNNDEEDGLPEIVDGKQILKMTASRSGYSPSYLKVRAGIPVRWEITVTQVSGCTNAIIARKLFDGQIDLYQGQTSVKEFTPDKPGLYKFSCWMGMVSGTLEVVD